MVASAQLDFGEILQKILFSHNIPPQVTLAGHVPPGLAVAAVDLLMMPEYPVDH